MALQITPALRVLISRCSHPPLPDVPAEQHPERGYLGALKYLNIAIKCRRIYMQNPGHPLT